MARHTRETMRIQARLDRALLEHLRDEVATLGERCEALERDVCHADARADMFHDAFTQAMDARPDVVPGLTMAGEIVILDRPQAQP